MGGVYHIGVIVVKDKYVIKGCERKCQCNQYNKSPRLSPSKAGDWRRQIA